MLGLRWWLGGRVRLPVETRVWSLGREDPLEEEMASFSSILAWKIPRKEEPGGLQSVGRKELDTTEWLNGHTHTGAGDMGCSHVQLFATLFTVACQAPPSTGFSRQEYWSMLPFPSPGDIPGSGIEAGSPALQADSLLSEPPTGATPDCHWDLENWM